MPETVFELTPSPNLSPKGERNMSHRTLGMSALDRDQALEALAVAAAQVHLGAVVQADAPVAAHPRRHLGDARHVHHVGLVDAHEAAGIEFALEPAERGA